MDFEDFKEICRDEIVDYLPETYKDAEVKLVPVRKSGNNYEEMCVVRAENTCLPVINMNMFYQEYCKCGDLSRILENMAAAILSEQEFASPNIHDYATVKDHLFLRVMNEKNIPDCGLVTKTVLDLKVVAYIDMRTVVQRADSFSCVAVSNEMLKAWNISEEDVLCQANANGKRLFPCQINSLSGIMAGTGLVAEKNRKETAPVYVISSVENVPYGAAEIFYDGILDSVAELYEENFYLLPSSVHEIIVLPESMGMNPEQLDSMVYDINRMQVSPEERLSDRCYYYDVKNKTLRYGSEDADCLKSSV